MKSRNRLTSTQLIIIVLVGIALACLVGVLNGLYTLGQAISDAEGVPAAFVASKVARAEIYGYTALLSTAAAIVLIVLEWRQIK